MTDQRRFTPRSRAAWRGWLEKNHAEQREVWVVFYKRHTGKPTLSYGDAVEEALCFGWIDGVKRSVDAARYAHRFSPRNDSSRWSETNKRRVERLRRAGLMAPAGEATVRHAKRSGIWSARAAPLEIKMPAELAERLRRDKRAGTFFESLAPSYQRQYMGWIDTAKRRATRERRADEAVALLRCGDKLGMR